MQSSDYCPPRSPPYSPIDLGSRFLPGSRHDTLRATTHREPQDSSTILRVALIGPAPAKTGTRPQSGVAPYLIELLSALSGRHDVHLLAQADAAIRRAGHTTVCPTWNPTLAAPLQIWRSLALLRPDVVHLQHEFNLYGGSVPTALVTSVIGIRRHLGRPVILTLHGVVDPADITRDFIERNYLPGNERSVRTAFRSAYSLISASSSELIVHHQHFHDILNHSYNVPVGKITVIPLGHAPQEIRSATHDNPNILVLGFLTGYKHPEAVVELAESELLPGAHFQFCIGNNPRITAPEYLQRYEALRGRVSKLPSQRAAMTGYVPEEQLPATLRQADVLVLPYSQCLAASAIAALAVRYSVPMCFSDSLIPMFGDGPGVFQLGDARSLAAAIAAVRYRTVPVRSESFAPWSEVASRTEAVWEAHCRAKLLQSTSVSQFRGPSPSPKRGNALPWSRRPQNGKGGFSRSTQ